MVSPSIYRSWLAVGTALAVAALMIVSVRTSPNANAGVALINTTKHQQSGFSNGSMAPFWVCTTKSPNYGNVTRVNGDQATKFFWTAAGYDGTRMDRGAEACGNVHVRKEGWYGFKFLLPKNGFPRNKNTIIAQLFNLGGCKSWVSTLIVEKNQLWLDHRGACGTPTRIRLDANLVRDRWIPVTIHFVASRAKAGKIEVWYKDAPRNKPTYQATGINFSSFGTYDGDQLANVPNNSIGMKFGMYCADSAGYTKNETRTMYFDNVSQLNGNPANAFDLVNPRT